MAKATKTPKAIPKLDERVIKMADDGDSFFRAVYLAIGTGIYVPLINDVFVTANAGHPFGEWLFMTSEEYDNEKEKKTNQIFLDDKEKMAQMAGHIKEYKSKKSDENVIYDIDDIYEFETNYNGKNENKNNQIKILIKNGDDVNVLVNGTTGETYCPISDPTFVVLQKQDGANHYDLVVTKGDRTYCRAYVHQFGKKCPLPPQYKDPLLKNLKEMYKTKSSPELQRLIEHIEKRKPIVVSDFNPATKAELDVVAGFETPSVSDASSVSNYSEDSEHVNALLFNALIALPSFFDSIVPNNVLPTKTTTIMCDNEKFKQALDNVTPSTNGLLGGTSKSRFSKKRGASKSAKRTKKLWNSR
jgi:hypothetical protein